MKKYRTPAGNVRSETDLIAKYGQDRFDELVKDGTLELVLGDDTEKKIQTTPPIQIRKRKLRNLLQKQH